ncbi:MAG: cysteine hydrolase [Thermoleophilia bacterium]|nr:cysteine hydrolase [Thermoleophilia bacterium]
MNDWSLAGKPALLVVHMQDSLCRVGGALEDMGHCKAAREAGIIPNIQALQKAFRAKALPVVFVVARHPAEFKVPAHGPFWSAAGTMRINLEGTSDVEIIDELAPAAGEPVFYNWVFNIFQTNGLAQYLEEQSIHTVVLTGVATGMAIASNSFGLADRLYSLIVPSDTCADANQELHDTVLGSMLPPIALVTTAEDVIAHLPVRSPSGTSGCSSAESC